MRREVEQVGRFELHRLPDGSEVYFDPEPHAYYGEVKAAKKAPGGYSAVRDSRHTGVSTPVKALDTNVDPLLGWAAKLEAQGAIELLSATAEHQGFPTDGEALHRELVQAGLDWRSVRDRAATRGTNVHELIFLALAQERRPPSLSRLSDEERAYGQAAMRWWRDHQPEPLYAEQVTLCRGHNVAGRFDLLCRIEGEVVLVDAKTREKGAVRRGDHAQLAGYEMCNEASGIGASDRRVALILCPDGSYAEHDCLADEGDFVAALEAYRRGSALEKRMRDAEKADKALVPA